MRFSIHPVTLLPCNLHHALAVMAFRDEWPRGETSVGPQASLRLPTETCAGGCSCPSAEPGCYLFFHRFLLTTSVSYMSELAPGGVCWQELGFCAEALQSTFQWAHRNHQDTTAQLVGTTASEPQPPEAALGLQFLLVDYRKEKASPGK